MRNRPAFSLAALVAATAAAWAIAQAPATTYVDEPVASLAAGVQADERTNAVVQALNADASLKGSKLTVAPDGDDLVYLTGVTVTRDQMKRALELAGSGGGKVANAITSEQLVISSNVPPQVTASDSAPATPEMGSAPDVEPILPATPDAGEKIVPATPQS
jgi:hypothetical protein